jgi:hypothetical protein
VKMSEQMSDRELSDSEVLNSPEFITGVSVVGIPLLLAAVRCTLQYVLVPIVLPLIGISGVLGSWVNLLAEVVALGVIIYNIRRLWNTNWRERYLAMSAVMIIVIGLSVYPDIRYLNGQL